MNCSYPEFKTFLNFSVTGTLQATYDLYPSPFNISNISAHVLLSVVASFGDATLMT